MAKKLYVGNLAYQITDKELEEFFSQFVNIIAGSGKVIKDYVTGNSRGFAFIEVEDGDLENALKLDGKEFAGRNLNVREAQPLGERRNNRRDYRN